MQCAVQFLPLLLDPGRDEGLAQNSDREAKIVSEGPMKALHVFAMTIAATQFPPAIAQIGSQRPVEQIIAQAHAAFSNATSAKEIEAVELWCRDSLVLLSFRERDGLMASPISLLRDNEFEEANAAFERLRRYDQSNKNIDDHACKSDVLDEGRRQTLQAAAIVTLSKSE